MERIRRFWQRRDDAVAYEPLDDADDASGDAGAGRGRIESPRVDWFEYGIFVLQGVAMLWSWNMFLAAAPYFQTRFATSPYLLTHFQSSIVTVSTVANLAGMLLLTKLQAGASYPRRTIAALILNISCFTVLALLAVFFTNIAPESYFVLLMILVFLASVATALSQNGAFAYAAGLGVGEYTQAIMTGQGIAGVAPCVVQIIAILSVPAHGRDGREGEGEVSPRSACAYFGTAMVVSAFALVAFIHLVRRNPESDRSKGARILTEELETSEAMASSQFSLRKVTGLWALFLKLKWLAVAVFITYAVTMQFPVYTQKILSNKDPALASRLFQPVVFIPLGFLLWNIGDLIGKMAPVVPLLNIADRPKTVLLLSLARLIWIPLYHLCNVRGEGAVIPSDFFYLIVVQLLFGMTGGWLGSVCMMSPSVWVDESELEAAGAFMGLALVGGLSAGSIVSFASA